MKRWAYATWTLRLVTVTLTAAFLAAPGCEPYTQPQYWEVAELSGDAYDRGFQHGQRFANKISSFYNKMLDTSILPYLNREQRDIADVLPYYGEDPYTEGRFSYLMLLESAHNLERFIPEQYLQEMRGIADGSGVAYEKILVLNTFLDTMLGFRAITFFIKQIQAPMPVSLVFDGLENDGSDNNGDGGSDESGEGRFDPYLPMPHAVAVEVPLDSAFTMRLLDRKFDASAMSPDAPPPRNPDPEVVDPDSVRIQVNTTVYTTESLNGQGGPLIQTSVPEDNPHALDIHFIPPSGWPAASVVSVIVQAGDMCRIVDPPPLHARYMRDERFVFTTRGFGKAPFEVHNRGEDDGKSQPPSVGFAVRGSATTDGSLLMGHHYALLDSNTSHKHPVLFLVKPAEGEGMPHMYLGWTGICYGFTGMNKKGLSYGINNSDTLSNSLVNEFVNNFFNYLMFDGDPVKLQSSGLPMGFLGREILSHHATVASAADFIRDTGHTYGWNVLLADATGDMRILETRSAIDELEMERITDVMSYGPDDRDLWGLPLASVGPDDLRMASHYNSFLNDDGYTEDINFRFLIFNVNPQRVWTTFYYRSLRAFFILGEQIGSRMDHGFDVAAMQEVLKLPDLVDDRDSMSCAVYEPQKMKVHFPMGQVPVTDGPFMDFDYGRYLDTGVVLLNGREVQP